MDKEDDALDQWRGTNGSLGKVSPLLLARSTLLFSDAAAAELIPIIQGSLSSMVFGYI